MTPLVHPQSDLATPKASFVLKFVSKFPKKPRFQARKGHKKGGVDLSAVHAAAPQSRGAALSGSEVEKMVEIQERRIVIELCAGDYRQRLEDIRDLMNYVAQGNLEAGQKATVDHG